MPGVEDLRAEQLAAEARVLVRLGAAQAMIDMHREDAIAEPAERVPQTCRVGAARDEAGDLAARRDQLVLVNVRLNAAEVLLHRGIVARVEEISRRARAKAHR